MAEQRQTVTLAYIVKMFPRISETFVLNEILEMERRGAQVVIFSVRKPNEGRFHPQITRLKAKVYYLEDLEPKKWPIWMTEVWPQMKTQSSEIWSLIDQTLSGDRNFPVDHIWWSAWIAAKARQHGVTHFHAHFASLPSTIAHLAGKIGGISYSLTAHAKDIFVYDPDEHFLRDKLQSAAFVVTVTNFNKRYLCESVEEAHPDKIKVIHNGIDLEQFKPDNTATRKSHRILGVGRLVVKKGFKDLIDACAILKEKEVPFECLLAGDGPEAEPLAQQCRELNLEDQIKFLGACTVDEVNSLMRSATVFCLPCVQAPDNNQDALPTVLLESLAVGLPSISTTVSGIPEIIDSGEDGILVEPNNPRQLAADLERLLVSDKLREQFSVNGRQKAIAKFNLQTNAGQLLETILSHRSSNAGQVLQAAGGVD